MPEFLSLVTPDEALDLLFNVLNPEVKSEIVQTEKALGRVTTEDILSPQDLPDFKRSTVDGYAVLAKDTHGAGETLPAYLIIKDEVPMGEEPDFSLASQECASIHTGGMLPRDADAVVMLEDTQILESGDIEVFRAVARGENVIEVGEDVSAGETVIPKGTRLRPAEIGGLMALGFTSIKTAIPPVIGILSSGDEIIPPSQKTKPGEVRDINSYTLAALIEDLGGEVVHYGIIADSRDEMLKALEKAQQECDHLIVTAGSSASARDLTAEIMNILGDPGVLVHGINIKPGKPTIFAVSGEKVMIGLPGNPVSALVIATILISPIIEAYLGIRGSRPKPALSAELTVNISSQTGREDWIPVRVVRTPEGSFQAEPVFGRSNLIFILARSDGLIRIPASATGLEAGTMVTVRLI
jgi:molybdopterin molybdotransferase